MSKYVNNFDSIETLTAVNGICAVTQGRHRDNPFFVLCSDQLEKLKETLRASIACHAQETLSRKAEEIDLLFNKSFVNFRSMAEITMYISEYGVRAAACGTVAGIIERHDRDLHEKPKPIQITLMDSVHKELDADSENSVVDTAGLRPLYKTVLQHHNDLKAVENKKKLVTSANGNVESPSDIAKEAKQIIVLLRDHLTDFRKLGSADYDETLLKIDGELAPLITEVKANHSHGTEPERF